MNFTKDTYKYSIEVNVKYCTCCNSHYDSKGGRFVISRHDDDPIKRVFQIADSTWKDIDPDYQITKLSVEAIDDNNIILGDQ